MLKISAFYLDKQKSFIPKKKIEVYHVPWIALISAKRWRLDVLTFLIHGFGSDSIFLVIKRIRQISLFCWQKGFSTLCLTKYCPQQSFVILNFFQIRQKSKQKCAEHYPVFSSMKNKYL